MIAPARYSSSLRSSSSFHSENITCSFMARCDSPKSASTYCKILFRQLLFHIGNPSSREFYIPQKSVYSNNRGTPATAGLEGSMPKLPNSQTLDRAFSTILCCIGLKSLEILRISMIHFGDLCEKQSVVFMGRCG